MQNLRDLLHYMTWRKSIQIENADLKFGATPTCNQQQITNDIVDRGPQHSECGVADFRYGPASRKNVRVLLIRSVHLQRITS